MVKKGVVDYLIRMLERHNFEFLILMLTFLKKLSIFGENKDRVCLQKFSYTLDPYRHEFHFMYYVHVIRKSAELPP